MTIEQENSEGLSIAKLSGHVDTLNAAELESSLLALTESGTKQLLVDCTPLEYIKSMVTESPAAKGRQGGARQQ